MSLNFCKLDRTSGGQLAVHNARRFFRFFLLQKESLLLLECLEVYIRALGAGLNSLDDLDHDDTSEDKDTLDEETD